MKIQYFMFVTNFVYLSTWSTQRPILGRKAEVFVYYLLSNSENFHETILREKR